MGLSFYPDSNSAENSGTDRARAFSEAGIAKVGGEPEPAPMTREVPGEPSGLARLYGRDGPKEAPQGPQGMAGDHWRGEAIDRLPLAADPTAHDLHARAAAEPATPAAEAEPQPSAAVDAELMAAFTDTADDLGLGEREQQRLLALH